MPLLLISETRRRLKEWGIWARESEPSLSSMFKAMFRSGAQDLREMPPHIQEVDHIVCTAPKDMRIVLIKFYGTTGTYYEKAIALGVDRRTLKRRIDRADYYVHSRLDEFPRKAYLIQQTAALHRNEPRVNSHPPHLEPA